MIKVCGFARSAGIASMAGALLLGAPGSAAAAPTPGPTPTPAPPPQSQGVDPVARAEAAQALAAANAPAITKITIVGTDIAGTPAVANSSGTVPSTPVQVNAASPDSTGYTAFRYGADPAGATNFWVKTRGTAMNDYAAVQLGDRIVTDFWQAGTGSQTGHAGGTRALVDSATFTAGEVAGRWVVFTGTGIHSTQATPQYPKRFGSLNALMVNSYQQVMVPGGTGIAPPLPGANFGGWVVIGAGAPSPGFGPLKFTATGAQLLSMPEAGAFEVDAAAAPYFTAADGVRRSFVLNDTSAPTVKVMPGAGPGATASIDAQGNSGLITFTTGAVTTIGDQLILAYAHAYPSASYPVITAANAAAVTAVQGAFVEATSSGFTLNVSAGLAPNTVYAFTFHAPGK